MAGEIDSVRDDGGGGVGHGSGVGENGDRVGDAKRETATAPSAGGDTTNGLSGGERRSTEERRTVRTLNDSDDEVLAGFEVEGDVAAIVDVSFVERGSIGHRLEDFFRDRSGYGSHGRDEALCGVRCDGFSHAASNHAGQPGFEIGLAT